MNLEGYERYLRYFNTRDYDAIISHFTEDADVVFGGYAFRGHQAIREFYAFFHALVDEQITLHRFVSDCDTMALEVTVRFTARESLTEQMLEERGLVGLFALDKGQVVDVPQFIHYHLREGRFAKALCAVFAPAQTIYTSLP